MRKNKRNSRAIKGTSGTASATPCLVGRSRFGLMETDPSCREPAGLADDVHSVNAPEDTLKREA